MGSQISIRLQQLIDVKKINLTSFAKMIGKNPAQVSRWLNGKPEPSRSSCIKIAEKTGCSFEWLYTGTGGMFNERTGSISEYSYREAKLPENQPVGTQAAETEYSPRASREEFSKLASQRLMRMVNWLYDEFDGNMMQLDSWLDEFYRNLYKNDYAYHKWWREQSEPVKKQDAGRSNDTQKAAGDG